LLEIPKKRNWDERERELSFSQRLFLGSLEQIDFAFEIPIDYATLSELELGIGDRIRFEILKEPTSNPNVDQT
jgi:hypothetical protein